MPLDSVFYRHNSPGSSRAAQIARQKMHSKRIKLGTGIFHVRVRHWNFGPEIFGPRPKFFGENFGPPGPIISKIRSALKFFGPDVVF